MERKKTARNGILLSYICCFLIVSNANPQIVKSTKYIKDDLNKIVPAVNIRGKG